jgi:hypothetical protein
MNATNQQASIELQGRVWPVRQIQEIGQWVKENPTWSRYRLSRSTVRPHRLGAAQRTDGGHGGAQFPQQTPGPVAD